MQLSLQLKAFSIRPCLTLHSYVQRLGSGFCVAYMDDVSIGGGLQILLNDIEIMKEAKSVGLILNPSKSEIIGSSHISLRASLPGAHVVAPSDATFLGSPVGDVNCISRAIAMKTEALERMGERLELLSAHDALTLLRNCFALPKLLYLLRTAPCFSSSSLSDFDECLCRILSKVSNSQIAVNDCAWAQASLPVNFGGLGVRSAVVVAPSAFLASSHASADLVDLLVPDGSAFQSSPFIEDALALWSQDHPHSPPEGVEAGKQKAWDSVRSRLIADELLQNAKDDTDRVRLLAVSTKESGAWLEALPVTSLGLRLDDTALRIGVGLRLGIPICSPHVCQHCGCAVDSFGRHGLSCKKIGDRHYRHGALNEIIKRALISAHVPCRLEPQGLFRSDGKRPDGASLVPWKSGKLIAWDATCRDSFAPSYRSSSTHSPGAVANLAESSKCRKYQHLSPSHCFTPVAFESLGAVGSMTLAFLKDIGRRIHLVTGEARASFFLLQRLSVAVQRGNSALVCGCIG